MIENVIFDLGGVLIDWNPRYLYGKIFGDEAADGRFFKKRDHPRVERKTGCRPQLR